MVDEEELDPSVPTELLELHVELEKEEVTPEKFKEVYGDGKTGDESSVGSKEP